MMPYWSLEQLRSFQVPSDLVILAQSSSPLLFGSLVFHFLEPSAHVALLGWQSLDGVLQIVSVKLLSPDVVPLSHIHVASVAISFAPIQMALPYVP